MKSSTRFGQFISVTTSALAFACAAATASAQTPTQTPPTQTPSTPSQPQPSQPRPTPPSGTPQNPTNPTKPAGTGSATGVNKGSQGSSQSRNMSPASQQFIKMAAQDGEAEIALAEVVNSQSQNADVKALAQKIKDDHTKANEELQTLASSKQVTVPHEPTPAQKATKDRLAKLNGAALDRAYVSEMVKDHQKAVAEFTKQTKSADADVKAFAEKTLPTLQEHLQQAQSLQKKVAGNGNGNGTGSGTRDNQAGAAKGKGRGGK